MKAEFTDTITTEEMKIFTSHKKIKLPFKHVSARALIVRKRDGAMLGTLHRKGGSYALPGGAIEDGESAAKAVMRELKEENIILIDPEPGWKTRIVVDYFDGYRELSVWYLILVEDAEIGESEENIESRWLTQDEDSWYPSMREKLILMINRYLPGITTKSVTVN